MKTYQTNKILFSIFLMLIFVQSAIAQSNLVSGNITDSNGLPLGGATVILKETTNGTITDFDGNFEISNVPEGANSLMVSYLGYRSIEVSVTSGQTNVNITLEEDAMQMDEVIVTGVFDQRTKMESSVAISTVGAKEISQRAIISAADILSETPGVYVNSSLGEIRNVVYSRGVSAGSTDALSGYYYVSLQEDGLPVTNVSFSNWGPDYFYRPDATLNKLEAVRGGTAAITSANAPGGIFNYVSKKGGKEVGGEVRLKYGLQSGENNYYRADFNIGGALGENWSYNLGGFYRSDEGNRDPGYPLNEGGQFKVNVEGKLKNGSITFYGKYLDDANGWYEFLPTKGFDDPKLVSGVSKTDSYLPPKYSSRIPLLNETDYKNFDPSRKVQNQDVAVGMDFKYDLGNGWKIRNNFKYTSKDREWEHGGIIYPQAIDDFNTHILPGTLGVFGTYSFKDMVTGVEVASLQQDPMFDGSGNFIGFNFTVLSSDLPGQDIIKDGILSQTALYDSTQVDEIMEQFSISKKLNDDMSINAGLFYGYSDVYQIGGLAGSGFSYIENQPRMLDVSVVGYDGLTRQVTDSGGLANVGALGMREITIKQNQTAFFFGHNWDINPNLNLDWGIRFESVNVKGTNSPGNANPNAGDPTYGGVDGDPLTLYDNAFNVPGTDYDFDKTLSTFSYSAGLNYKLSENKAIYGRFSVGKKAPDMGFYFGIDSQFEIDNLEPKAETVTQLEFGFKARGENYSFIATPFYSLLDDVRATNSFLNLDGTFYSPPTLLNSIETYGIEFEGNYKLSNHFEITAVATVQSATAKNWEVWIVGGPGPDDDTIQDFSGNDADNNATLMATITPKYTNGKFYTFLTSKYMGKRAANVPNAFYLPGFNQFDFAAGYSFSKAIQLSLNINNLFGSNGVMSWSAPGGFPAALDRQGFTQDMLNADPNATYGTIMVQPTSYFLTFTYGF